MSLWIETNASKNNRTRGSLFHLSSDPIIPGIIIGFIVFIGVATLILQYKINKEWPPLNEWDIRAKAIELNKTQIDQLSVPIVYAFLSTAAINEQALNAYSAAKEEIYKKNGVKLENLAITTSKQIITLSTEFSVEIRDKDVTVEGILLGNISPVIVDEFLYPMPHFSTLRVTNIDIGKPKLPTKSLASAINALLKTFLVNINGEIIRKSIPTQLTIEPMLFNENFKNNLKKSNPDIISVTLNHQQLDILLQNAAILITDKGVEVLASGHASVGPIKEEGIPQLPTIPDVGETTLSHEEILRQFNAYLTTFYEKNSVLHDSSTGTDYARFALDKVFLVDSVSETVKSVNLCLSHALDEKSESVTAHVGGFKPEDYICDSTKDCTFSHIECKKKGCSAGNWSCEVREARKKASCELRKSGKKFDCERIKSQDRIWCETKKEVAKQFKDWGRLKSETKLRGEASACLNRFDIDNFESISTDITVGASGKVGASLKFTPHNILGTVFGCKLPWKKSVRMGVTVPSQERSPSASLKRCTGNAGDPEACQVFAEENLGTDFSLTTVFSVTVAETQIEGQLDPSPYIALVGQNPELIVNCSLGGKASILFALKITCKHLKIPGEAACQNISKAWGEVMEGKINNKIDENHFPMEIPHPKVMVGETVLPVKSDFTGKTIQYYITERAP